jgi:outer membrane protein TolC
MPTIARTAPLAGPVAPLADVHRITLRAALTQALSRHPAVAIAEDEIRRSRALVEQVRAASLPSLTGNVAFTRLDHDRTFNGNVIAAASQINANALVTIPLVVPSQWARWGQAREAVDVSRAAAATVQQRLAAQVASAYLTILAQRNIIAALEHARDNARAHLDVAHARYAGAIGSRLDEARASQQVAAVEAQLETALGTMAQAREALGVVVGVNEPLDAADEPPLNLPVPLATALDGIERLRADVRQLEAARRLAERVARESWSDYLPTLAAIFQPFTQNPPTLTQPQFGWQAQVMLTLPIFDGLARDGLRHERQALAAENRSSLEQAVRQARADVRAAFETVVRADAALARARISAQLAADTLALANLSYRVGTATGLDVLDAERASLDAETGVAAAADAARRARLGLLTSSGRFP